MSSNSSNSTDNITSVMQVAVSQAVAKSKEWYVPKEQTSTVATFLWNVAAAGFVLNVVLLYRCLTKKLPLLRPPSPHILVNMCISNLLLVLGVLLALLTLSFDLGKSSVQAGEAELFFTVGVLLQSWLGQVMVAFCGLWTRKWQKQGKFHCPEILQSSDSNRGEKRESALSMSCRSTSRQRLYQPCRRHSRLTQTFKERSSTTSVSVNRPREVFAAASNFSVSTKEKQTVRWWLVWSWLLSLLAATALLMTTADGQDGCLSLIPFQTMYIIPGDDIHMVKVRGNSVMKVPFVLVLVPVYVVGLGCTMWSVCKPEDCQRFLSQRKSHHASAEGGKAGEKKFAKPWRSVSLSNTSLLKKMKGHKQDEEKVDITFESREAESTCNINVNAVEHFQCFFPRERQFQRKKKDQPNLYQVEQHGENVQQTTLTQRGKQNPVNPKMPTLFNSLQENAGLDDFSSSREENDSLRNYCTSLGVALEEKHSTVLPSFDASTDVQQEETNSCNVQKLTSFQKKTQNAYETSNEIPDLSLSDEYVTQFSDATLNCLSPTKDDTTFPHDMSTVACPKEMTPQAYTASYQSAPKAQTTLMGSDEGSSISILSEICNESIINEGGREKSFKLGSTRKIVKAGQENSKAASNQYNANPKRSGTHEGTFKGAAKTLNNRHNQQLSKIGEIRKEKSSRSVSGPTNSVSSSLSKSSKPEEKETAKTVDNQNNNANKPPPKTSGSQDRTAGGKHGSRMLLDPGRSRETDADSLSSSGNSTNFANSCAKLGTVVPVPTLDPCVQHTFLHPEAVNLPLVDAQSLARPRHSSPPQVVSRLKQREGPGPQGRGRLQGGLRPAIHIVSSSMHHFTIQGRPPLTGHFQLYPPGWLDQDRFHPVPSVWSRQQQQQQQRRQRPRSGCHRGARSRLSAHTSHPYQNRQPTDTKDQADAERHHASSSVTEGQASTSDPTPAQQTLITGLQSGTHLTPHQQKNAGEEPVQQSHRTGTKQNQQEAKTSASWKSVHDVRRPDDTRASFSEHSHQVSLQSCSFTSAQSWYRTSLISGQPIFREGSHQSWTPHHLAKLVSEGDASSTTNTAGPGTAENHYRSASYAMEEYNRGAGAGDTNVSDSKPKRDCDKKWSCPFGDRLSFKVKCLMGLMMHVLLCLPFAVTLAPGVFRDSDCGTRLKTLLVVRLLMFCHVIVCPVWMMYCFPRHLFSQ